jgi:pilus assembly protein TadC
MTVSWLTASWPTAMICAAACAAATGALLAMGPALTACRLAGLLPGPSSVAAPESAAGPDREPVLGRVSRPVRGRPAVAVLTGVASGLVIGGLPGLLVGVVVAAGTARVLARLEPRERRRRVARLLADLPVAVDLLAACLSGGVAWGEAVEAVAAAIGGPLGAELRAVAAQVRLGADPAVAWLALGREPALAPLARTVARAARSGTALAPTLARLAHDQRRAAHLDAAARARAAGVRAVVPLGLCFLPAFCLLGIVPAIAGIATALPLG